MPADMMMGNNFMGNPQNHHSQQGIPHLRHPPTMLLPHHPSLIGGFPPNHHPHVHPHQQGHATSVAGHGGGIPGDIQSHIHLGPTCQVALARRSNETSDNHIFTFCSSLSCLNLVCGHLKVLKCLRKGSWQFYEDCCYFNDVTLEIFCFIFNLYICFQLFYELSQNEYFVKIFKLV